MQQRIRVRRLPDHGRKAWPRAQHPARHLLCPFVVLLQRPQHRPEFGVDAWHGRVALEERECGDRLFEPQHGGQVRVRFRGDGRGACEQTTVSCQTVAQQRRRVLLQHDGSRAARLHQRAEPQVRFRADVGFRQQFETQTAQQLRLDPDREAGHPRQPHHVRHPDLQCVQTDGGAFQGRGHRSTARTAAIGSAFSGCGRRAGADPRMDSRTACRIAPTVVRSDQ